MVTRCPWALGSDLELNYHDKEWGVPEYQDQVLFEFIILEGAQAGLSWKTVLQKRDHYRKVLDGFDPVVIAGYKEEKLNQLLQDPGIIRNRLKIKSIQQNALAFLKIQEKFGSFSTYLWQHTNQQPMKNHWQHLSEVPAQTPLAVALSKDLKKQGFNFVGPTICYAFMQAVGLVNDHLVTCFRHSEI
jgi:DNA-3-methyladenine glycosylase I